MLISGINANTTGKTQLSTNRTQLLYRGTTNYTYHRDGEYSKSAIIRVDARGKELQSVADPFEFFVVNVKRIINRQPDIDRIKQGLSYVTDTETLVQGAAEEFLKSAWRSIGYVRELRYGIYEASSNEELLADSYGSAESKKLRATA